MLDSILFLSVVLGSLSHVIDKRLGGGVGAWERTVFGITFQAVLLVPFFALWRTPPLGALLALLSVGALTGIARYYWYKSLNQDALSRLAPLQRLSSVFIIVFATVFLGEIQEAGWLALLGSLIVVGAALVIAIENVGDSVRALFSANRSLAGVLLQSLSLAVMVTVSRYLFTTEGVGIFTAYLTIKAGQVCVVLPALAKPTRVQRIWVVSVSQLLQLAGAVLYYFVLSKQSAMECEAVAATAPLVTVLLSRWLLDEQDAFGRRRIVAACAMVVGYLTMRGVFIA